MYIQEGTEGFLVFENVCYQLCHEIGYMANICFGSSDVEIV